ncbi:MAG: hypothetical protein PHE25_04620 [Candidatus Gracilibacteria bacterium]|nr:hypothetical protein [Candidatus Gracilibacteria bacterium]
MKKLNKKLGTLIIGSLLVLPVVVMADDTITNTNSTSSGTIYFEAPPNPGQQPNSTTQNNTTNSTSSGITDFSTPPTSEQQYPDLSKTNNNIDYGNNSINLKGKIDGYKVIYLGIHILEQEMFCDIKFLLLIKIEM